jgi:hypothetical protein
MPLAPTSLLLLQLFLTPEASFAQQGVITGTVADAGTLAPVSGAQVFIAGTVIGTRTDENRDAISALVRTHELSKAPELDESDRVSIWRRLGLPEDECLRMAEEDS